MARTLPTTVVQAIMAESTTQVYLVLAEFTHAEFTTVRVVNNTQSVTSNGDPYAAFPFSVILPPDDEDLSVRAQVIVYDVERELIDNVRAMAGNRERIAVSFYVIEADDPDTILQSISGLYIEGVSYDAGAVQLDLSIDNYLSEAYPKDTFSPGNFPGIF